MLAAAPPRRPPETVADFDEAYARAAAFAEQLSAEPLARLRPETETWTAGDVSILTVQTAEADLGIAPLVYVHGGGFTVGSARTTLLTAALAAEASGRVVHSIDYTVAPHARCAEILEQVFSAWSAVVDRSGHTPALMGDSAGGCIAAAATLLIRDRGATVPAALVLFSPLVDLAGEGETGQTLAAVDYMDRAMLLPGLLAYAPSSSWDDPLVSPIHGDVSPGFPPTLFQAGTRERLLSDSVRMHRKLRAAGRHSRLEVYEGMPHGFQSLLAQTPEGREAWTEVAAFFDEHLR